MGAAVELTGRAPGAEREGGDPSVASAIAAAEPRRRARIALLPPGARRTRPRLLDALEQVHPVRFKEPACSVRELGAAGYDGVLVLGGALPAELPASLPCLHALGEERGAADAEAPAAGGARTLALAAHDALERPLRGARLTDRRVAPLPAGALAALGPERVTLASIAGAPAWMHEPVAADPRPAADGAADVGRELLAAAPAELEPGESLRERLAPERCLALLALVHFLRRVARTEAGEPPVETPLHAAFVLDDPNLHAPRYGHLRYAELARHAERHGYHMAIAMPPIDGWFAHPRAAQIFREHPARLSLCIHGNDHLGGELGRVRSAAPGYALARQALARAAAFERRTGLAFERVMVPPHEQLTEPAARGLRGAGFAATCVSRPYPWIAPTRPGPAAALGSGPRERGALAGWGACELVAGGLPVLLRTGFNAPREDLVLRAFLGQPLIVYGHHDTLAGGLDVLAETAAAIDALGDISWRSLAAVARGIVPATADGITATGPGARAAVLDSERPATRPRLRPLLRRLASEARDRARL
jgi:hypothetical protein